eukprot:4939198-Amphidinium_carterae.1
MHYTCSLKESSGQVGPRFHLSSHSGQAQVASPHWRWWHSSLGMHSSRREHTNYHSPIQQAASVPKVWVGMAGLAHINLGSAIKLRSAPAAVACATPEQRRTTPRSASTPWQLRISVLAMLNKPFRKSSLA